MERITEKTLQGYSVPPERLPDALRRLGELEDWMESLEAERDALSARLDALRKEGKEKSARFRETLGEKLLVSSISTRLSAALARPLDGGTAKEERRVKSEK